MSTIFEVCQSCCGDRFRVVFKNISLLAWGVACGITLTVQRCGFIEGTLQLLVSKLRTGSEYT